ncbi:uncharacterized protein BCR38DRAFT_450741 [Pseudomassariella vexata]|uniref:FAD-binding domain-containing protein n=1 Tax=Pseudomassariella vexata TaxID=1141098 RepID=A0A1Y2DBI3_9PEZI|nr:uncharacterized protein BCR38DRAFT_450741 [Pseudomassariella vexata]ORY56620.1 hypothetical protein BCR38DRAFT_450741 [Pseudomassariella vexata]
MTSVVPKIAIVGAGPAGLTLARLLHVSGLKLEVTLLERDLSPASRREQGGTLDLHTHTGLAAIKKCGLWDEFQKHARYDGQEVILMDKNATELVHKRVTSTLQDRPEIDRVWLRKILLDAVPGCWINWGRKVRTVTDDGKVRLDVLAEGNGGEVKAEGAEEEGPFDLIVGADGAWSRVRQRLMPHVTPRYSGVSGYEVAIFEPTKTCPHVDKMVGQGMFIGLSDRKSLNAQRLGDGSIRVRSWSYCPETEAQETLNKLGKEGTREKILERFATWAPEMTEPFRHGDLDSLMHMTLYELPVGSKWDHQKGFTLIGDAASLTTPFSGEGVNKAMKDSLELAELIEKSQEPNDDLTLDEAVLRYEKLMFPRAEKLQAKTILYRDAMLGPNAPLGLFSDMLKTIAGDSPSFFVRLLGSAPVVALVYSYFWVYIQIGWAVRKFWRRT